MNAPLYPSKIWSGTFEDLMQEETQKRAKLLCHLDATDLRFGLPEKCVSLHCEERFMHSFVLQWRVVTLVSRARSQPKPTSHRTSWALGFFPCWMCNSHETLLPHLLWSPPRSLHSTLHHYAQNTPIHLPLGGSSSSELTRDLQPHQTWHCDRVWGFSANTCRVKLAAVLCHYPTYEEQKWWCCLEVRCCSLGDRYAVYC